MREASRKALFSSVRIDWATPWRLFEMLDSEFKFELDLCADGTNNKCETFFSEDGLTRSWRGRCWMNPPYGKDIGDWVSKAYHAAVINGATVVCLLPARTDTIWFHEYCMKAKEIRFLRGRLAFDDSNRKRAPFPSMIVIFG